ncbi:MAG: T9SS type A sorting domain-containing protein [Bacteroidales bacterium]
MQSKAQHIRFFFSLAALLILCSGNTFLRAQYHPAADQPGTSAIHRDSAVFIDWGSSLYEFERGWININNPALGKTTYGDSSAALNAADGLVVSLGDKGYATIQFNTPIANGHGWDFAVFENAFDHYFLELAFVEVSSDGNHFVRFPAASHTATHTQKGPFDTLNPQRINNLAGKYKGDYGTPFDLEELKDSSLLDIQNIRYVRILDVCGSLSDTVASYDAFGRKINDPFPTETASGGFDLDAIGVLNNQTTTTASTSVAKQTHVYPNPANQQLNISSKEKIYKLILSNSKGYPVIAKTVEGHAFQLNTNTLASGLYILTLQKTNSQEKIKIIIDH